MEKGIFISKRSLMFLVGGAVGVLTALGLGKTINKLKPLLVGVGKETYAFKEWVQEKYEMTKEDIEDIIAEAKYAFHKELELSSESIKKEKDLLEKIEKILEMKKTKESKED